MKLSVWVTFLTLFFFSETYSKSIYEMIFIDGDKYEFKEFSCNHLHSGLKYDKLLSKDLVRRPYDVLSYNLYMDWVNPLSQDKININGVPYVDSTDRIWKGINSMKIRIDSFNVEFIELDAADFLINSVTLNSVKLSNTPQPVNNILKIPLNPNIKVGDTINLSIEYTYKSNTQDGFFLYPKKMFVGVIPNTNDTAWVEERIAYTMSQPESARKWMPCNDNPYDKAVSTIKVRVPLGFIVASNGLLQKIDTLTDKTTIYYWADDAPVATYLMAATASKYVIMKDWYKKVSNPNDSIPIIHFVWDKDFRSTKTDGTEYNATRALSTTARMMEIFSEVYIEYPFSKYGTVILQPFWAGGMEHQTLSSINRVWLRTNEQFGLAHELAHQWIGDLITCASWKDIWINEGGATWSEAIYAEHSINKNFYNALMLNRRATYFKGGGIALFRSYNPPMKDLFNYYITYAKSSWIYHMLRTMLGDEVFFNTLRNLLNEYKYKSLTTEDFKEFFIRSVPNPPISFDAFFNNWVYSPGHPIFNLISETYRKVDNKYLTKITLNQTQTFSEVPEVFITPVKVDFYNEGEIKNSEILVIDSRSKTFDLVLDFLPDSVSIDTTYILCEVSSVITNIKEISDENFLDGIFPNPATSNQDVNLRTFINTDKIQIEIYDALGRKIKDIINADLRNGNYEINLPVKGLPAGSYKVLVKDNRNYKAYKLILY
ncbi:MAG: M1 family aminopeptidase [Candidatus Kapabacteria bacterium]|nr:M1 family aminopeptidase [Candidatus Kapabacteria bacterium]